MRKNVCPTQGFERLLLATDGSEYSRSAVDEAIKIAAACSGRLVALQVIEVSEEVELWDAMSADKIEREAKRNLDAIREKAGRAGVECDTVIHLGDDPYKLIIDEAKNRKVSTIIMGSHGRTGLTRLMMGSTVSRVIGHAPCNVLVVPISKRKK